MRLRPVDARNEQALRALAVTEEQRAFVTSVDAYLALCRRAGSPWKPLAVEVGGATVGFVMHAVDDDGSWWIGGLVVDRTHQRRGIGRAVVEQLTARGLAEGRPSVALAFHPANAAARTLYEELGFRATGELDGDEVVARRYAGPPGAGAPS